MLERNLHEWIEWSRRELAELPELPTLDDRWFADQGVPWDLASMEHLDECAVDAGACDWLAHHLECFLAAGPFDVPTRFTVLHFCSQVARAHSAHSEEMAGPARREIRKTLAYLVRCLKPEECPDDWRLVAWEIRNAIAIDDGERALTLYDLAESHKLLAPVSVQVLRGTLRLLLLSQRPDENKLRSFLWQPTVLTSHDVLAGLLLLQALNRRIESTSEAADNIRVMLRDCINDLSKGLDKANDSALGYRALLARAHSEVGDHATAGQQYELLLDAETTVSVPRYDAKSGEWAFEQQDLRPQVYRLACDACRAAGLNEKALQLAERWAVEYRSNADALGNLLTVQVDEVRPDAFRTLEQLAEICPEWRRDPKVQLALVKARLTEAAPSSPHRMRGNVRELVQRDEGQELEFKATARWNIAAARADERMEQEILETIGGFLNSYEGGTLLIGVEDGGRIRGIEEDYATFSGVKRDRSHDERWLRDEYQRWLLQKVKSRIKSALPGLVAVDFEDVEGRTVCVVTVSRAPGEAWLHDKKSEPAFYVRQGNMTIRLLGPDITGYSKARWPS